MTVHVFVTGVENQAAAWSLATFFAAVLTLIAFVANRLMRAAQRRRARTDDQPVPSIVEHAHVVSFTGSGAKGFARTPAMRVH